MTVAQTLLSTNSGNSDFRENYHSGNVFLYLLHNLIAVSINCQISKVRQFYTSALLLQYAVPRLGKGTLGLPGGIAYI